MQFANPIFLVFIPVVLIIGALFFLYVEKRLQKRLKLFAAVKLIPNLTASASRGKRYLKYSLTLFALSLFLVALSRPQYGFTIQENEGRGIDVMIALDTSRSMLAEDIKPNRLERSKLAIFDLMNRLEGDRMGLIAFAGSAFLQCPLTLDFDAFRQTLNAINTETIPVGGTDLAVAINEAEASFGDDNNFKLLVLITDGEDLEASGIAAAREVAQKGVRVFTVGVGNPAGELIPIKNKNGSQEYLRDETGKLVRSTLDEGTLQAIAASTNGIYAPLGATGSGLVEVYEQGLAQIPPEELGLQIQQVPLEQYQWPLGLGIVLLFIEFLLGTRRKPRITAHLARATVVLFFLSLLFPGAGNVAQASSLSEAKNFFDKGDYTAAAEAYSKLLEGKKNLPRLQYNYGIALYRSEQFEAAEKAFTLALESTDSKLQADAFFNLGNTLYQLGKDAFSEDNLKLAQSYWEDALTNYNNASALDSTASDVQNNLSSVQTAIESVTWNLETIVSDSNAGRANPDGRFYRGATVQLSAEANDGWIFRSWTGHQMENPDQANAEITLNEDTSLVANFVKTWQLDVLSADETQGTAKESGRYPEDEPVTITAEAKDKYAFSHWTFEGGVQLEDPKAKETTLEISRDGSVTAHFVDAFHLEVKWEPEIGGKAGLTDYYEVFTTVPIKAEPREGFEFINWTGEGLQDATVAETGVTLTEDRTVVAHFNRLWNLIVVPNDEAGGKVTGSGDFEWGTVTPITAQANEGYLFDHWEGPGVDDPSAAETTVTVLSDEQDIFAVFVQDESEQNKDDQSDQQENDQDQQDQDQSDQQQQEDQQSQENEQNQQNEQSDDASEQEESQDAQSEEEKAEEEQQSQSEEETEDEEQNAASEAENTEGEETEEAQQRIAGQMTPVEARQLLNALRESEQKLPVIQIPSKEDENSTGRDW